MTTLSKPGKGKVVTRHYKELKPGESDMRQWPDGNDFLEILSKERLQPKQKGDCVFWQAAIRWSLLKRYKLCPNDRIENPYLDQKDQPYRMLQFSEEDVAEINKVWEDHCKIALSSSFDEKAEEDDLVQFLKSAMSNNRLLKWSVLDCGPACQFKLHAHPNIEIIYCIAGSLHEIRMEGEPITKAFEKEASVDGKGDDNHVKGPDLTSVDRVWKFGTLQEGDFLVNEVGSIHRSFSATNGDGCLLLAFWGGSHADVMPEEEPQRVNIKSAMDTMDKRLCNCTESTLLSEVFLPDSERSGP